MSIRRAKAAPSSGRNIHLAMLQPEATGAGIAGSPQAKAVLAQGGGLVDEQFQRLMADNGVTCSMRRSGNVWDNAVMESFFSSLKTERVGQKIYRTRAQAKADMFDYIECFYNPNRRYSTLAYLSPIDFELEAGVA